ncbi:MAG: hypothetical protein FWE19_00385 [Oscillospiraceae bacterium]|nr:hypothetical protein [Oscillospiraceae bacterium]
MKIKQAAEFISDRLIESGCLIHRYNAYSTKSIYLKVDAGVACSIRISDHKGKRHLNYRFNLMANEQGKMVRKEKGKFDRFYYQSGATRKLVEDVLALRKERMARYEGYDALVWQNLEQGKEAQGFWQQAYCVNEVKEKATLEAGTSKGGTGKETTV